METSGRWRGLEECDGVRASHRDRERGRPSRARAKAFDGAKTPIAPDLAGWPLDLIPDLEPCLGLARGVLGLKVGFWGMGFRTEASAFRNKLKRPKFG